MFHSTSLATGALLVLFSTAYADDSPKKADGEAAGALDIISKDAVAAIAIRNVAELTERGDEFITQTGLNVPMRLSEAYRFVTAFLGVADGLDEKGAAALMVFGLEFNENSFVLAVPVADFKAMAANFGMDRDRLVAGKVIDRQEFKDVSAISFVRYLAVRDKHVFLGGDAKTVERAAQGKTLRASLLAEDREAFAADDIFFYGNAKALKEMWHDPLTSIERELDDLPEDEAKVLRQLVATADELQYIAAGLRLDEGFGANVVLRFDGAGSREILTRLQGDKSKTSLHGLPSGRVIAAHASSGDGDNSAAVARVLLHFLFTTFSIQTDEFVSLGHRSNVVGVFGDGWQRLDGSRTALYENEHSERDGLFSLIAVLETDDAQQFVKDMTELARFINASGFSLDDSAEAIDARTIQSLIAELGDDEYRVRQLASTKLSLIGKSALPALEQATKSEDAETSYRARMVRQQINDSLAAAREDLLKKDLLSRIKPNFVYFPAQETRSDRPVDIVRLQLQLEDASAAAQLENLLGPQWSRMRLATVDNRVIILLGSNTSLLDQTIALAQSDDQANAAGIAKDNPYVIFRQRAAAERTVEFHLSLASAEKLIARDADVTEPTNKPVSTTSIGLSIAPQRIRFDLFAPYDEAKVAIKRMGW